jgi:hypothetical protein
MKNKISMKVAAAAALLGVVGLAPAYGSFTMTLDDGLGHTASITDNGSGDLNPATGGIIFSGALAGSAWSINVDVASSKPLLGGQFDPRMDLTIESAISTGAGTLTVTISDTGFGPLGADTGVATLLMGGTLDNGSVTGSGKVNGSSVVSLGPFTTHAWSGGPVGGVASGLASTFTLGESVVITHTGAGNTTGNFEFNVVPEPSTVIAGALLLLPFGASTLRCLRNRKHAA